MSIKNKYWYKIGNFFSKQLGMKRIGYSGAKWPNKEDAENDDFICQIKTTSGKSINIKLQDVEQLISRSLIQHKIPLFVFSFENCKYNTRMTWVSIPLYDIINYINI